MKHWHLFDTSKAIRKNKIYTRTHFNQEMICFRDSAGKVHIFDAYCPHLGAHLGMGGKIKNDRVVCPFHGWQYNTEGSCVHIPYCDKIPKKAQLGHFPSLEKDGMIYFYWENEV